VTKAEFTPEQYGKNLQMLIAKAREFSDKILIIGITPVDEVQRAQEKDITYTNNRILEFEEVLHQVCEDEGLPHLPLYGTLKNRMDSGEHLFDDGLHPNDAGHQLIFEFVRPELDKLLAA
jgi:lysophospholipase L1-like esterase